MRPLVLLCFGVSLPNEAMGKRPRRDVSIVFSFTRLDFGFRVLTKQMYEGPTPNLPQRLTDLHVSRLWLRHAHRSQWAHLQSMRSSYLPQQI